MNLFWATLKDKFFARKKNEDLESKEFLCLPNPRTLTISTGWGYESLRKWIECLNSNVIDRPFMVKNQSLIDRSEQTLSLDSSQLASIEYGTVHLAHCLASHLNDI